MKVEPTMPIVGLESPIDAIREIQQDRLVRDNPENEPVIVFQVKNGVTNVESRLPAEDTLEMLGAAYMRVWKDLNPGKDPRQQLLVPDKRIVLAQ